MVSINYDLMRKYFENNTALLSLNKIDEFFQKVAIDDRMMVETFMRTELGINVFDYITVIPEGLFAYNQDLKEITVPATIKNIEPRAFMGCVATKITLDAPIIELEEETFKDCTRLTEIKLPNTLAVMKPRAFQGCTHILSIDLPDSIRNIRPGVFNSVNANLKLKLSKDLVIAGKVAIPVQGDEGLFFKKSIEWK